MVRMKKLKRMLKAKNIKAKDLAAAVGVISSNVSHHARFGIKTTRVAKRYAKVLGCSPFELLD